MFMICKECGRLVKIDPQNDYLYEECICPECKNYDAIHQILGKNIIKYYYYDDEDFY